VKNTFRILGIDPGSRLVGYGILDFCQGKVSHVTHGTLKIASTSGKAEKPLEQRLLDIHTELSSILKEFEPNVMAIERVFFAKNASSSLKLGQARGAIILTGALFNLKIFEYSATEIKAAVTGSGNAQKEQVAAMLKARLGNLQFHTLDASDALAAALCHTQNFRHTRIPDTKNKKKSKSLADALGLTAQKIIR
jgi:crossover junction endodeoxyribonuclease RuvC